MDKLRLAVVACILAVGLTACDSPALLAPSAPSYSGGHTYGGGNRAASDTASSTTVVTSTAETTTDDSTAERGGGHTIGTGN